MWEVGDLVSLKTKGWDGYGFEYSTISKSFKINGKQKYSITSASGHIMSAVSEEELSPFGFKGGSV